MKKAPGPGRARKLTYAPLVFLTLSTGAGCAAGDAPKAWNSLSACLAGKAAQEPLVARVQHLRLIQLANSAATPSKDAWPMRCGAHADELYAALPSSGQSAVLRRKLSERLGCREEKGSCAVPVGSPLLSITTELWDAAKDSGLKAEAAPGVPMPEASPPPVLDAKSWKSFSAKPTRLAGPIRTSDGRALVLLKPSEGRARPTACEFTEGLGKLRCFEANPSVPELPAHTIELVNDSSGVYAAALTEKGMVAYNLQTGDVSEVRGRARQLIRDGIAVEPAAKDDVSAAPPAPNAKPAVKEEGFLAVQLKAGKASKEIKLPADSVGDPISIGEHIAFVTQTEAGTQLNLKTLAGGRLKDVAALKGTFIGSLRTCRAGEQVVVATWSGRSGQQGAKAEAGKTRVGLALFREGAWSKALEGTLPFERAFESELVCTPVGASIAWVQAVDGGAQVGRLDCSADGCKPSEVKLSGVESKWWWTVAPLGDKVLLVWRSSLGETRMRVAALSDLAGAKDTLLFDSPDFNGPNAGELSAVVADNAALLIFRGEQPVALHAARDGAVRLLVP